MNISTRPAPVTLVFSAHDPTGAAGVQADIESINRNGGRCVSVLTAVTSQNTDEFDFIRPQEPAEFRRQAELLLADITVHACKTGLIGHPGLIEEIATILKKIREVPLVVDPILHSGTGADLSSREILKALRDYLLPMTTVLTPNVKEALSLSGQTSKEAAAAFLFETGCRSVLITGADEATHGVINTLYQRSQKPVEYQWERLPGTYHGSGCTLASAIAARLAIHEDIQTAVEQAQSYTFKSLKHGVKIGRSQFHPDRNFKD